MNDQWREFLTDTTVWSEELAVVLSGNYIPLRVTENWLVLLSATEGDTIINCGSRVQARLAVNRTTGEIERPPQEIDIDEWEATILGELRRYLADMERLRTSHTALDTRRAGIIQRGILKEVGRDQIQGDPGTTASGSSDDGSHQDGDGPCTE